MGHVIITVAVQLLLIVAGVPPVLAGSLPVAFYAGREHAQAEQRIIEARYGTRARMPWWGGLSRAAWTRKAVRDLAVPAVAAAVVAICFL